ncbi:DUF3089 domain-containing protein [Sphingosinicella sp. LHD-64]|uniref:DUF3089 domain-containing protein n=1 Tax=Sphingosinicella sp. LHD-64 TaxID=3072139 RepID=UPI00280E3BC9|nr:DUF3089 domain-containing protein [Sphingosinicella sp. LHD-64]MDQ8755884.1 DUF3089 domain-containing protein [Sphingosinicella sp. LHD-64]
MKTLLAVLALGLAVPAAAQAPAEAPAQVDYANQASWLCLPGRADACGAPQQVADLTPAGYGPVTRSAPAADPPIDCFYVYPTLSRDSTLNSDMNPGPEEQAAAAVQLARFGSVCKTYAPLYRQATLASIFAMAQGTDVAPVMALAYRDVLAAWRHYMAHYNRGRPYVLIGHSQGMIHLQGLIAQEIEGKPAAAQMVSAILLGWAVEVPEGQTTGGTFRQTPLCTRAGQTGCVVSYMTFRADAPPPDGSMFGRAVRPGMTAACTNPANLGGGTGRLDSYWFTAAPLQPGAEPITWSRTGPPPAQFLHTEGLVSGNCVHSGQVGYLALTVNADPADARTDRIPGDVYLLGQRNPGWGTHLIDMAVAQGDLVRLVGAQAAAFARR